jgi:uncharacterized protein
MTFKTSEKEEQYFQEQELKRRLKHAAEEQAHAAAQEKRRLKELHWLHCPKCGQGLTTEKYATVEIDVCPTCKGLWLDATELETIVASTGKGSTFHSFLKVLGA